MDLDKPGFFHFDTDLTEGKLSHDKIEYWYKKQEQQLRHSPTTCPELGAIENTLGIFTYLLKGRNEAVTYFEILLGKPGRTKVNTIANLVFLLGEDSDRGAKLTQELQHVQRDDSLKSKLEIARARCERGHFCGNYVLEEVRNADLTQVAAVLLKQGIEEGKLSGMGPSEFCIWQFYLFKATKDVFVNQTIRDNSIKDFDVTMVSYLDFHAVADETPDRYKGLALVEVAVMFSFQRDEIKEHRNFVKFCQEEETLKQIWEDVTSACDEAMALDINDYRICHKAARVYSRVESFDKAQECIEKSLELNSDQNLTAMNCQMILYNKRGIKASKIQKDERAALDWYRKAYKCGKEIVTANEYVTTATLVEMMTICCNMAVDKTTQPWHVPPEKEGYLDEAIEYGERAVSSFTYSVNARGLSVLGECYAFKKNYIKAAKYVGLAVVDERPGKTGTLLKYWRYLSEKYHQYRQQESVDEIATAFEKAWQKHPKEAVLEVFVKYGNNYIALKDRLIQKVIEELSTRNNEIAAEVLHEFCVAIDRNLCKAAWLKDVCQRYL